MSEPQTVTPVPAATVILLRRADEGFELFMVRRHIKSDFASDVYVFPGGKVDPGDAGSSCALELTHVPGGDAVEPSCGWRALFMAAVRELFEESGILLGQEEHGPLDLSKQEDIDRFAQHREKVRGGVLSLSSLAELEGISYSGDRLLLFSNWVTPAVLTKRFDTYFFLAENPPFQEATHSDLRELTDSLWITPDQALRRHHEKSFPLVYATIRHLEQLRTFRTLEDLLEFPSGKSLLPVHPRSVIKNGHEEFLIPGDPGYSGAASE